MSAAEPLSAPRSVHPGWLLAFRPRRAMREILERGGRQPIAILVIAAFLATAIGEGEVETLRRAAGETGWGLTLLFATGIMLAVCAVGLGLFYGFAWFATHTGRLLDGSGSFRDVLAALAWGLTPAIWALLFRIPAMILWPSASSVVYEPSNDSGIRIGDGAFTIRGTEVADAPWWQVALLTGLEIAVFVWFLVVASRTLGEAQKISPWKALANLVLALILPAAAMIVAIVAAAIAKG